MTVVLFAATIVVVSVAVAGVLVLWARMLGRRQAARARAELEELVRSGAGKAAGDLVVLRGKLVVDGHGCASDLPVRGSKVAASTRWLSMSRIRHRGAVPDAAERAERLRLEVGGGVVVLDGPTRVVVGSRLHWMGHSFALPGKHYGAVTAIDDGDDVLALGVRHTEAASEAKGSDAYRAGAARGRLEPPLDTGVIQLASVSGPRVSLSRAALLRHPAILLGAVIAMVPGCALARDYDKTSAVCADTCAHSGRCQVIVRFEKEPKDALLQFAKMSVFACAAASDVDCHASSACRAMGLCTAVDGDCRAATEGDCAHLRSCLDYGSCSALDGACGTTRDEECRDTQSCRDSGRCSAVNGSCSAVRDEDCRSTQYCRSLGNCSAVEGSCTPAKDEDCRLSDGCKSLEHCSAVGGSCVVGKDEDCRTSKYCAKDGSCTALEGACVASKDADCESSRDCAESRECKAAEGNCVEDDGACKSSAACRIHGRCSGYGYCEARSNRDCEQSLGCKERGACKRFGAECAASCAATELCHSIGWCAEIPAGTPRTEDARVCWPASDADCAGSRSCKRDGGCSAVEGRCVAKTAADCKRSEGCLDYGLCSAADSKCVAGKDEDCHRSAACRERGACSARDGECTAATNDDCAQTSFCRWYGHCIPEGGDCKRGRTDANCKSLPSCKEAGLCSAEGTECKAIKPDDCRQSQVCARFGWCEAVAGECVGRPRGLG